MLVKVVWVVALLLAVCPSLAVAQHSEVAITLNEAFFDALLDSIFQNFDPPQFQIGSSASVETPARSGGPAGPEPCTESIKVLREMDGVRTAVRFRDGKVLVPLAFSGKYEPPLIGCVDFSGWAETNLDLVFDREGQRLIGQIHVLNVSLSGTGGVGGTVIAKLIQSSIDKRLNPIEIVRLDRLSLAVPVQNSGTLMLRAVSIRPQIENTQLTLHVDYELSKAR